VLDIAGRELAIIGVVALMVIAPRFWR